MVKVFDNDIVKAFTGGESVNAIYTNGVKVWPIIKNYRWVEKVWNISFGGNSVYHFNGHIYHNGAILEEGSLVYNAKFELVDGVWIKNAFQPEYYGSNIWYDNDGHIYYDDGYTHKEYVNGVWVNKEWEGHEINQGANVWKDNDGNIYYSNYSTQYMLVDGVWRDDFDFPHCNIGRGVWYDNDGHIYYNADELYDGKTVYKSCELLDGYWEEKDWDIEFTGNNVWYDNDGHIYFSWYGNQYELIAE